MYARIISGKYEVKGYMAYWYLFRGQDVLWHFFFVQWHVEYVLEIYGLIENTTKENEIAGILNVASKYLLWDLISHKCLNLFGNIGQPHVRRQNII